MRISVIDLGSNSIRMTVADIASNSYETVFDDRKAVRLSEGLTDDSNTLKPKPMMRTLEALKSFKEKSESLQSQKVYLIATEAVRRADNQSDFIDTVLRETGLELCVLTGDEETEYDAISAMNETGMINFLLLDTGGGSSEIAVVREGRIENLICLPWGAVTLNSKFAKDVTVTETEFKSMTAYISEGLDKLPWISAAKGLPMVALGGSVRCYGELCNGCDLESFTYKLLGMTIGQRNDFGVPKKRSDTIVAGIVPALMIYNLINPSDFVICKSGVREGFILKKAKE